MMNEKNVLPVCPDCNCILYEVEDDPVGLKCSEFNVMRRPA